MPSKDGSSIALARSVPPPPIYMEVPPTVIPPPPVVEPIAPPPAPPASQASPQYPHMYERPWTNSRSYPGASLAI